MASGVLADEFETWLTPKQAVRLLDSELGSGSDSFTSEHTLLERLRAGKVHAIAGDSRRSDRTTSIALYEIPSNHWKHVSENTIFWISGDLTFRATEGHGVVEIRHFDVRYEPDAVRAIIAPASKQTSPLGSSDGELEPAEKGPPVSQADLRAWYEVYQRTYPAELNTEPHAHKSAQGMFHDKSVTRAAIRELRGSHKPGPKGPRQN